MEKTHPLFHKLKSVIGYSIAIVVIVIALGVSGLRFILTTANIYQSEVEQLASSLLEQQVKIGRMDAKLSGLMPTLIFHDVQLISEQTKKPLFSLGRIDIGISVSALLLQQKITPEQLTIRGMNLQVTRTVEGNLKIKGVEFGALGKKGKNESGLLLERWLSQQGEIAIEDSTVAWKDEQNSGLSWFFDDVNILLKKSNERYQLLLSSDLPNILGDKIKIAIDLVGDITIPESWDINAFVESKGFNLIPIQKYTKNKFIKLTSGVADLSLWIDWKNENIKQLSGDIQLHDFTYQYSKKQAVTLKQLSGVFDSHLDENDLWNVSVDNFHYESNANVLENSTFSLAFNYKETIENFYIKTNYMKLGALSKIITDNHLVSREIEERIKNLDVEGDVHDFYIAWQDNELHKLKTNFSDFGINSWKNIPKVKALTGSVNFEHQEGVISLLSKHSAIGFPNLFRDDFKLDDLRADIEFSNTKQGLLFDIKHLITKNIEVSTISTAKVWLPNNGASPYLDLQTYVSDGDVSKVSHYLPVSIMDKTLVNWIDNGLVSGKLEKASVVFNGKLSDFPFNNKEGEFSVALKTSDLLVHYQEGWPDINKAKINGKFTGQGMSLHLLSGEVENNLIYDSRAGIPSFSKAELKLDLAARGSTNNTMKYLINSPILPEARNTINSMNLHGNVDVKMKINIPLDDVLRKNKLLTYSGSAKLRDASIFMLGDKINITDASGNIFFTDESVSSKNLQAKILGEHATLSVTSPPKSKSIEISALGEIKPGIILQRFAIPGANKVSGSTQFKASMFFPEKSIKNQYPTLILNSDLVGVESSLPEQFNKKKDTRQKVEFMTVFTGNEVVQLGVEFGKKGSAVLEIDQSKSSAYLRRGAISASSKKAILPTKNILYVDGAINKITPSKWAEALELGKGKQTFFVKPIIFNLDTLGILSENKTADEKNVSIVDPKNIPAFEGIINKLYFDKVFLGRFDFNVSQNKYGIHVDELIVSSKNMKLFINGDWQYTGDHHKSNMNITLSSQDFGGMLTDLGFAVVIDKGTAQANGKINWNGAPTQFSLKKLNGSFKLNLENGNIVDVDAEAGRLLGLFSLSALPRKLFGDFKDTFKSGFSFDKAIGDLKIDDGDVYTDDFKISSAVAEITVSGRTGLADRDYDNIIKVIPDVGGGIAGVTALLINLPAGIGLWLVDKLTGKQFNAASTRTYEINGSWDKPIIELVKDESK